MGLIPRAPQRTPYSVTLHDDTVSVATAQELTVVLEITPPEHAQSLLVQMRDHLADLLEGDPAGLVGLLRPLAPEDQVLVLETLGKRLAETICTSRWLRVLLSVVSSISLGPAPHLQHLKGIDPRLAGIARKSPYVQGLLAHVAVADVEERLFDILGRAGLQQLICSAEDLADILQLQHGFRGQNLLRTLGREHLRKLVRTSRQLAVILQNLTHSGEDTLFRRLDWERITGFIHDDEDLLSILRGLSAEHARQLLSRYSPAALEKLAGSRAVLKTLVGKLDPEKGDHLGRLLKRNGHGS